MSALPALKTLNCLCGVRSGFRTTKTGFRVACDSCKARGVRCKTAREAVKLWNRDVRQMAPILL